MLFIFILYLTFFLDGAVYLFTKHIKNTKNLENPNKLNPIPSCSQNIFIHFFDRKLIDHLISTKLLCFDTMTSGISIFFFSLLYSLLVNQQNLAKLVKNIINWNKNLRFINWMLSLMKCGKYLL